MRDTPLESVVGMQQNTARPKANSGVRNGNRSTANAVSRARNQHIACSFIRN